MLSKEQAVDNRSTFYNLPYITQQIFEEFKPVQECMNLGLLLDKYMPNSVFEKAGKAPWLLDILKPKDGNTTPNYHIDNVFAENAYNRWYKMMGSLGAETFDLALDWRMIVGLGGETVIETDITLHHLYGIPIIPGSALKGLTRAYAAGEDKDYYIPEDKPKEEREPSKEIEKDHSEIKRIFGKQDEAGTVCFFDAMPLNGQAQYVLDIMNPHYPNYYNSLQSNKIIAPANDQLPNPVVFLTVTNTKFTFALAPRNAKNKGDVELVKKWLQKALLKYGVGGKTSAGYGYFKEEQLEVIYPSESGHVQETSTLSQPVKKAESRERIQVNIPQFRIGQDITGSVLAPIDELRQRAPSNAHAFLRYQSFASSDLLIVVIAEEAQNWKSGETRICQLIRQEERDGCTVLICQPRPGKKKKN
jgi:CRISPR type III-B/RAMP module RAMP protein Cmr6